MRKLIFIILILITFTSTGVSAEEPLILKLKVEGAIDPIVADYVARGIAEAKENNATALIIQLDTPGGLDLAMRKIIKDIQSSSVPVITYVYPKGARAASAGSFILIASHIAAMAPGTNVGAAHPVSIEGRDVSEKIVNDAKAYIKSLAKLRGRNVTLAESFVVNSTSITAEEALEYNIIDIVAEDYPSLLAQLDGKRVENKTLKTKNAKIKEIPMNFREEILHIISNPNIAYILFMAGIYGIIFELANPGAILPGVVGGICILLAFWSFQALSITSTGIALILFAIALFIADLKAPTHGILTAGGIISLLFGSIMLINVEKTKFIKISLKVILPSILLTLLFFIFAIGLAIKAHKRKPTTGKEGLIGLVGEVKEDLSPEGMVLIKGEIWKAKAKGDKTIEEGKKVKVVDVRDLTLIVEEV